MVIKDQNLLLAFKLAPRCEWCGQRGYLQAHHLFTRGMGGGGRLDVPINLVSLCVCCHRLHHDGHEPLTLDLLGVVARREGTTQDAIRAEIQRLRRLDRHAR